MISSHDLVFLPPDSQSGSSAHSIDGASTGKLEGISVGDFVENLEGTTLGGILGNPDGTALVDSVGKPEGRALGDPLGGLEGTVLGDLLGNVEGAPLSLGTLEGAALGDCPKLSLIVHRHFMLLLIVSQPRAMRISMTATTIVLLLLSSQYVYIPYPGVPYYYYKRYHIIIMRVIGIRD
jgi:hypothetical protein